MPVPAKFVPTSVCENVLVNEWLIDAVVTLDPAPSWPESGPGLVPFSPQCRMRRLPPATNQEMEGLAIGPCLPSGGTRGAAAATSSAS